GGGKRILPDADDPTTSARNEVWLTITTSDKNTPVYLDAFDVDDSSKLFATGQGGDNRGPVVRPDFPVPGFPSKGGFRLNDNQAITLTLNQPVMIPADPNSDTVHIKFVTTMQPGDNFKIVASVDPDLFKHVVIQQQQIVDTITNMPVPTTDNNNQPAPAMTS